MFLYRPEIDFVQFIEGFQLNCPVWNHDKVHIVQRMKLISHRGGMLHANN